MLTLTEILLSLMLTIFAKDKQKNGKGEIISPVCGSAESTVNIGAVYEVSADCVLVHSAKGHYL